MERNDPQVFSLSFMLCVQEELATATDSSSEVHQRLSNELAAARNQIAALEDSERSSRSEVKRLGMQYATCLFA